MINSLADRLHPTAFLKGRRLWAANVAYVLGKSWTSPAIAGVTCSDTEDLVYVHKADTVAFTACEA